MPLQLGQGQLMHFTLHAMKSLKNPLVMSSTQEQTVTWQTVYLTLASQIQLELASFVNLEL